MPEPDEGSGVSENHPTSQSFVFVNFSSTLLQNGCRFVRRPFCVEAVGAGVSRVRVKGTVLLTTFVFKSCQKNRPLDTNP